MDLQTLKIFTAVAAEMSITRAASRLGRAPSNVTTRIQQLEAELGAALFIRAGKRITLSAALCTTRQHPPEPPSRHRTKR